VPYSKCQKIDQNQIARNGKPAIPRALEVVSKMLVRKLNMETGILDKMQNMVL
jgi:hypothetical protein